MIVALFSIVSPGNAFLSFVNFRNILLDAASLSLLAVGMTFVVIARQIDLSVGSVLIFSSVVASQTCVAIAGTTQEVAAGVYPQLALGLAAGAAAGLLSGAAWGYVNGVLVARANIPSFVVTLGSLACALGLAQIISGGVNVRYVPLEVQSWFGGRVVLGLPAVVWLAGAIAVIFGIVLAGTRFGHHVYAIGSDEEAARRVGIDTVRVKISVFVWMGVLAGVAGLVDVARFTTTSLGGHATDNLAAIAAVVIGGGSLFGGRGTVLGTMVGIFIPAVLQNGFIINGVQPFWQSVIIGVLLVAAVGLDQLQRARSSGR
ncbi:ABC transporter permease [Mesorhizobium sp. CN2-181]|uniref:ABC transporter permease n=1 Tax=Mesorhizobium yinganensis TaxID=3157707 RepID=UPI0032B782EB